jgi:23S rRNA pseudouridine2605 synthase
MRLNRFLAQAGCGSRRACEALIREGRITINGVVVTELATQVEPGNHVKVGNRLLRNEPTLTAMLHKPRGYMCTADDPEGRPTIYELLPANWPRVFSVGRLDYDSEGLLLVTNDGDLSQRLTHPRHKLPKSYEVMLDREFDQNVTGPKLLKGIILEGKRAKFEAAHKIGPSTVKVVLTQGLKRQIRLMFQAFGYSVRRLVRTEIGKLHLGRLPVGKWEILSQEDLRRCFANQMKPRVSRSTSMKRPARREAP